MQNASTRRLQHEKADDVSFPGSVVVAAGHLVSADPGGGPACGVLGGGTRGETLVVEAFVGAERENDIVGPPGGCDPLQPARSPALPEGLGGPGLDQGSPQGGQESFGIPRKRFRVPFSTLEALLSLLFGELDKSRIPQS